MRWGTHHSARHGASARSALALYSRTRAATLAALFGVVATWSQPALSQNVQPADAPTTQPDAVIIFDGSGSMWGRLGSRTKHDIARQTMAALLPSYDRQIAMGLIAYGHRRKSDCNDIQVLASPASGQAADIVDSINRVQPRGKTPIASSLESAASLLFDSNNGHIVLLTDGVENCRKDLCDTVDAIREATPSLTISAIGLGLREKDLPRIQCISERGGGRLVTANTAAALTDGLLDILDDIASGVSLSPSGTTAPSTATVNKPPSPKPPQLQLRALQTRSGPLINDPVTWRVTRLGSPESQPVFAKAAAAPDLTVSAGRYRIEAALETATVAREIEVTETDSGPRSVHLPMNLARLDVAFGSPLLRGETIALIPADSAAGSPLPPRLITRQDTTSERFYLPPGNYAVRRTGSSINEDRTVSLREGDTVNVAFDKTLGTLKPSLAASTADALKQAAVYIVEKPNDTNPEQWTEVTRSAAPAPSFALPASRYRLSARTGQATFSQEVDVRTGETHTVVLEPKLAALQLATINLANIALPKPYRITITPKQTIPAKPRRTSQQNGTLFLKPGTYAITAEAGRTNLSVATEVVLRAGSTERAELTFNPSRLRLRITARTSQQPASPIQWQVTTQSADGTLVDVWNGTQRQPDLVLAPGRYDVTAKTGDRAVTQPVTITAGQSRSLELAHP